MAKEQRRRWPRYSLRTLLLVTVVFAVALGWKVERVRRQREAVKWIREKSGWVRYDYEFTFSEKDGSITITGSQEPGPEWLSNLLGIDSVAEVVHVTLFNDEVDDLSPLAGLKTIQSLNIRCAAVTDISPLQKMTAIRRLDLNDMPVSDLSPLAGMTRMRVLHLQGTQVKDLSPLVGMKEVTVYLDKDQEVDVPKELEGRVHRH